MLTEKQREDLLPEMSHPYTDEELSLHLTDRSLKSVCEKLHAHNFALMQCLLNWQRHLRGDAPEPETKIWKALRPGRNNENEACNTLDDLIEEVVKYGFGNVPALPILVFSSRSTATLIEKLDYVFHTPHIDTMDSTAKEAFALITYRGPKKLSKFDFADELHRLKEEFVKACVENASELHSFVWKGGRPPVEKPEDKITRVVVDEAVKTRQTVKATAKKAVKEIRTNAQSEYDKRGPSSAVRAFQLKAVIKRMKEFKADISTLPAPLRKKDPAKWIHQACREVWVKKDGGYPSIDSLYVYCHRNAEKILSLAGI